MLVILVVGILIGRVAHYWALLISNAAQLSVVAAQIVFFLIYFAGLIGIFIFLTFSSFFLIVKELGVVESIKNCQGNRWKDR